ncbi:sulfotransferase family protein [Leptothoe spongobia]|uniref:Sulfotransferase n=1 Tax=Leptothoe spongobia TAU-MAC 1115 TaxID=1967444 RepID=A0A947GKF1_9CYAN|nr:sulfotransferase [Leptothoe spongobia]MBT9314051.1 sulfotransferase [Leptothoe spongobia TAU-MAC 1115]
MTQQTLRSTLENNQSPWWVQWINWGGHNLEKLGIQPVQFSEAVLLATAQKHTQLSDWGDEAFREGLQTLIKALNQEANLSLIGRLLIRKQLVRLLKNRLTIQATLKQHPDILELSIQRPLIITGLPRTGTTFLQRLLAQDPKFRWLRFWELIAPCPPPIQANVNTDPRIQSGQRLIQQYQTLAPAISTAHRIDAEIPEEENHLFEHAFASVLFELRSHIPTYDQWLQQKDMVSEYGYFRQQLQLLSWQWSGQWLLKAPAHLGSLDALFTVFPDACVVQTHRDPCTVMPSICSLAAIIHSVYSDRIDTAQIGQDWLKILTHHYHQGHRFRQQHPDVRICDVDYNRLVHNPLATVRQIYEFFGDQLSDTAAHAMEQSLTRNSKLNKASHRYSLEQFGLTAAQVNESFS